MNKENRATAAAGPKITAVVNTLNAARHLRRVLEALQGFDEVLVCDQESDDDTVAIARSMGCRVVFFPRGEAKIAEPAREYAIHEAACEWVVSVDADEIVTPALRHTLYAIAARPQAGVGGWRTARLNRFMGRELRHNSPDYQLRFFRRDTTHWPPYVHAAPQVEGSVADIPKSEGMLLHLDDPSLADYFAKQNRYTDKEAEKKAARHYGVASLLLRPAWFFLRSYVVQGDCLNGRRGLIHAGMKAVYQFMIVAKIIEKRLQGQQQKGCSGAAATPEQPGA